MAKRGLAAADYETRQRVARLGGKASHSGGRPRGSKGGRSARRS
jgi:hypothetical protein